MIRCLLLDDERFPDDISWIKYPDDIEFDIVRSYAQFIEYIHNCGLPDLISFDHDLGIEHYKDYFRCLDTGTPLDYENYNEKTGYHCAKWLVDHCDKNNLELPDIIVHSMNIIGKDNILGLISSYKRHRKQNESN